MTREKMLELWKKEFEDSYHQWSLTPKVYDYFDGKTEYLEGPGLTGRKYWAYYEGWLVKELEGENAELARRMLVIISKIRSEGMIGASYRIKADAEICLRIGYDFSSMVEGSVQRFNDISADSMHWLAEKLVEYHPEDAEKYAERQIFEKEGVLDKNNRKLFFAYYIAVVLLKKDAEKYARFLPALVSIAKQSGGEYMIALLYYSYMLAPELKEGLLKQLQNTQTIRSLRIIMGKSDMYAFLQEIGAPLWPYYYLVASRLLEADYASVFRKLYETDKPVFMETCRNLLKTTGDMPYSLYLLALLMHNGEGQEELEEIRKALIVTMERLVNSYNNNGKISKDELLDDQYNWKPQLDNMRCFSWGADGRLFISALGLFYDHSDLAHRFTQILLQQGKGSDSYDNISIAVSYILDARKKWFSEPKEEGAKLLLGAGSNFTLPKLFKAYCYNSSLMQDALTPEFVKQNSQVALDLLNNGSLSIEETKEWLSMVYATCGLDNYEPLIALLSNKSKILRKEAENIIFKKEKEIRPVVEKGLPKFKGEALAIAKRLLKRWDNDRKFGVSFTFTNETVIEYCNDNYDKDNQKHISWIPENMFTDIRFADLTDKAPAVVLQYILSEYLSLEEPYKIKGCDMIAAMLHPQDLQAALENIYRLWKDNGAEAKKKMIMIAYCIYASDTQILALKNQLRDWADASRGAIAAFVVNAIAMNGGSVALMMIDAMSVKFPNNQVKNAAKAAFTFAAKALDMPEDELSDKIVPTLDFSKEGEKVLDYGSRTFKITLMPDFSLTIYDNDKQKEIKSMPAPGANDDTVKATAAKKEFAELKKQIKATVQSQTNRLEKVLINGRRWAVTAWNELFVENPIMHRFATGLIWGVYDGDKLVDTFRYMEDGTFNTVDEEEYELPEKAMITLVHPIELPEEVLAQWKEQLDDYEIVQPLPQLSVPTVTLDEKDCEGKKIVRYNRMLTKSGKIAGIAKKYNMVRGEVWDGGSYTCFHWVDKCLNVAALLNFEYMYMGQEYDEDVTLGEVIFYRLDEDQSTNDEPKGSAVLEASTLPARFVSSILGIFDPLKEE